MFEKTLIMYIYTETPLHPGSGTAISGAVDLPIQRERHTEFPIIQGSSLKGVLRGHAQFVGIDVENIVFGEPDKVGGISITDARILAFPVRSLKGLFGWITSPFVLSRFKRDMALMGKSLAWSILKVTPSSDDQAMVKLDSNLLIGNNIYIEDLKLNAKSSDELNEVINSTVDALPDTNEYQHLKEKLKRDLVILTDDLFRNLVLMTTEIATRIKIGRAGVVEEGSLWSEEYIPTDTIMYSLVLIPPRLKDLKPETVANKLRQYNNKVLHIGGDETIGKGFARIKLCEGK